MKNTCGVLPPQPLPYDDAGGSPQKDGLFLLNAVGVDLVSLSRPSWYFCSVLRLVHQPPLKFCPNNSLWLSEKMLAFSFNICLDLCSFIKVLRTDKRLLYVILLSTCPRIIIDCSVSSLNSTKSISTLSVLSLQFSAKFLTEDPEHLILFAGFFVKVYPPAFINIYDFLPKPLSRNHEEEQEVSHYFE